MRLGFVVVAALALAFDGCSAPKVSGLPDEGGRETRVAPVAPPAAGGRPSWVMNPGAVEGKVAGVGIAKPHINGRQAQRQLAIQRAIDEIAHQMGVSVTSMQKLSTVGASDHATTSMESYSFQTTSGKVVTAVAKAWWYDEANEELYVWMITQ